MTNQAPACPHPYLREAPIEPDALAQIEAEPFAGLIDFLIL